MRNFRSTALAASRAAVWVAGLALAAPTASAATTLAGTSKPLGGSFVGYVPLDGLSVEVDRPACAAGKTRLPLIGVLPDISVRFAVAQLTANSEAAYGPAAVTVKGEDYRAILDYVNNDVVPVDLDIIDTGNGYVVNQVTANTLSENKYTIPVLVGVGMRVRVELRALKSNVKIASLIGLAADAEKLAGTITAQTIGIAGKTIAAAQPLPTKLDQTATQNALMAIGLTRAAMFEDSASSGVYIKPRVVGLYTPIGNNPRLIAAIYAELAKNKPKWTWDCE